jgi:hypothetical protein
MRETPNSKQRQPRGSALVEAALVISLILVPLSLSLITIGFNLIRAVQANQINRDAGHMFARGVDFSTSPNGLANRGVLLQMAPALNTTAPSGTAVLIISQVQYIGASDCTGCVNLHCVVLTQRVVLGNPLLKTSAFTTDPIPATSLSTDGTGTVKDPTNDVKVLVHNISTYLTLSEDPVSGHGDIAYITETYFSSADLIIPGFPSPAGVSARAFF